MGQDFIAVLLIQLGVYYLGFSLLLQDYSQLREAYTVCSSLGCSVSVGMPRHVVNIMSVHRVGTVLSTHLIFSVQHITATPSIRRTGATAVLPSLCPGTGARSECDDNRFAAKFF